MYTQKFGIYYDEITDYYLKNLNHQSEGISSVAMRLSDDRRNMEAAEKACIASLTQDARQHDA